MIRIQQTFRRATLVAATLFLALGIRAQETVYQVNDVTAINYGDGRLLFRQAADPKAPLNGQYRLIDGVRSEYVLADFKDGMFNGSYRLYRRESLAEEATYKEGRLHGARRKYFSGGTTLAAEATFVDGKIDGVSRTYFSDGKVETEKEYKLGLDHGFDRRYHSETHKLTRNAIYRDGKQEGRCEEHIESNVGNYTRITNYRNGLPDGQWTETREDGTPLARTSYKEGKRDGVWITYRKNGTQERSTTYKADVKNGPETVFFTDGTPEKTINYVNNKRDGVTKEYYFGTDKPQVKAELTYKNGRQEGPYKRFDEKGILKEEGRCANDTEVDRRLYYPNGKLRSVAEKRGGGWVTTESYDSDGKKE